MNFRGAFGGRRIDRSNSRHLASSGGDTTHRGRRPRTWVATSSVLALLLMGATPALAEDGADAGADSAEVAGTEAASTELTVAETPPPVEPASPPPAPADPPPEASPSAGDGSGGAGEGPAPESTDSTGEEQGDDAGSSESGDSAAAEDQGPGIMADATAAPEPPYLRWHVTDEAGEVVPGATFTLQGPRDPSMTGDEADVASDLPWLDGLLASVTDNSGDAEYVGLDLDPEPGAILVKQLIDDADPTRVHDAAVGESYRVRPAQTPAGYLIGDDASWSEFGVLASADDAVPTLVLERAMSVARVLPPPNGGATINVNLRSLRGGGTAAAAGTQFRLHVDEQGGPSGSRYYYPGNPVEEPWATCTTDTDGDCSFQIPANSDALGERYWAVPYGLDGAGSFHSDYLVTGENTAQGSNRFAMTPYAFRTPVIQASNTPYHLPGGASMPDRSRVGAPVAPPLGLTTDTEDRWAHYPNEMVVSLDNNRYMPTCNVGTRVALVVDLSTSMVNPTDAGLVGAKAAATAFTNAFVNKGVTLGIYTFGTNANGSLLTPSTVTSANVGNFTSAINGMSVPSTQYTNWDRGLEQVADSDYDMVVVLTDGNPTRYRSGSGNGSWTDLRGIEEAILSANQLKTEGSQILAFGVGAYLRSDMPQNLRAVTGPNAWAGGQIANADYAITSDWTTVATQLGSLASTITCEATVQVKKQLKSESGDLSNGANWLLTPTKTGSGTMTPSGAQTTNASGLLPSPWTIKFTDQSQTASLQIAETDSSDDYDFDSVSCTNNGSEMDGIDNSATFTLTGLRNGDNVLCTVINKRVPTTVVATKTWLIKDAGGATLMTVHEPAQTGDPTLPSGMAAQLQLSSGSSSTLTNQAWGVARSGFSTSNTVTLDEKAVSPANDIVTRAGCELTSARVTSQKLGSGSPTNPNADLMGSATYTSPNLKAGSNSFEITNTVTCDTRLTLVKQLDTSYDESVADHWILTATGADQTVTGTKASGTIVNVPVKAGSYTLTEEQREGFSLLTDWTCVDRTVPIPVTGSSTTPVNPVRVNVPLGGNVTCTITNLEDEREASMVVSKAWLIRDKVSGTVIYDSDDGGTLPDGISAQLTVQTPGEDSGTPVPWGEVIDGLTDGDEVTVNETTTITGLPGCKLTSAKLAGVDQDPPPTALGEDGVAVTLGKGLNTYEVTNVIECASSIVVLKKVEGGGVGQPNDWTLSVANDNDPANPVTFPGASSPNANNTVPASAFDDYRVGEEPTASGASLAYLFDRLEVCFNFVDGVCDPSVASNWKMVEDPDAPVQVGVGQQAIYRFVNKLAPEVQVPRTGGVAGELYGGIGLSALALAALLGTAVWFASRRNTPTQTDNRTR